jgi:hypothetical protein
MKKLTLISIGSILLASCTDMISTKPFTVIVNTGTGLKFNQTHVDCDSFQMVSQKEIFIWNQKNKMRILGDQITVQSN